jgi:3-oxosteroid 1-dehydrogenase
MPKAVDLVVLGSGAAGLTAALTGALSDLSVLVLEHEAFVGGTSARSSGTVWIPDNPSMRAAETGGRGAAEQYLDALVGDRATRDLRLAFLDAGPTMLADLSERAGIVFRPYETAPDYRQDMPGAAPGWRSLEPLAFDGRDLGAHFADLAWPLPELMLFGGMMVTRGEAAQLLDPSRPIAAAWTGASLMLRYVADRTRWQRGTRLVLGNALVARLFRACLDRGVNIRTHTPTRRLSMTDGGVTAVETSDGPVAARKGVVLAGGGFPASPDWRARNLPVPAATHTPASPGARGRTLELGLDAGGTLGPSGMDNAL